MDNGTMTTVNTTALTLIGEKQRVAGEQSKKIASDFMDAVLAGKIEIAYEVLAAIENAIDQHKGNKGVTHAFTYAGIAQCKAILADMTRCSDAIGTEEWNKLYDSLGDKLARLSGFMPSNVSNGGSDKNVPLSDMLKGFKSVLLASGRTPLAWIPDEKSQATLATARKAEADRLERRNNPNKGKTQAIPAPAVQPATAPKQPRKPATPRKARASKVQAPTA